MAEDLSLEKERYRKVSTRMWVDEKFCALSRPQPNAQSLWQFLISGPCTSAVPGFVIGGPAGLAEWLDWDVDAFLRAFAEIESKKMAIPDWRSKLVWLPKAVYHNEPESPNHVRGWRKTWPQIPECNLKWTGYRALLNYCEARGKAFREAFQEVIQPYPQPTPQPYPQPSPNQEQEQEQEQEVLRAARAREPEIVENPEPSSEVGLSIVVQAYEKQQQGIMLAGRELLDVRGWIARGYKPGRIAEAITVVGEAMRGPLESRPKAFWSCVRAKLRDTPVDQRIVWHSSVASVATKARQGEDVPTLKRSRKDST